MDNFLPVQFKFAKAMQDFAMISRPFSLPTAFVGHQNLIREFQNPVFHLAQTFTPLSEQLGLGKILQQQQSLIRTFQRPLLTLAPALQEMSKQYLGLNHTIAEAMKGYQPWSSGISNHLKAVRLATHFSSIVLPIGLIDELRIKADISSPDFQIEETELTEKILASGTGNSSLTLDVILEALRDIENKVSELLSSSIKAAQRQSQLATYDRLVNHIGIILSLVMYFAQKADQHSTDEKMEQLEIGVEIVNQKIDRLTTDVLIVAEKMDLVQDKIESLLTSLARQDLRVCTNSTPLRLRPFSKSMCLGQVEQYQLINSVNLPEGEKKGKWIYVTFFDMTSGEPKSGWVQTKYFKKNKVLGTQ